MPLLLALHGTSSACHATPTLGACLQKLKVPCTCDYTIKDGDTWEAVAAKYKSSADSLKVLNPGIAAGDLPPQQVASFGGSVWFTMCVEAA